MKVEEIDGLTDALAEVHGRTSVGFFRTVLFRLAVGWTDGASAEAGYLWEQIRRAQTDGTLTIAPSEWINAIIPEGGRLFAIRGVPDSEIAFVFVFDYRDQVWVVYSTSGVNRPGHAWYEKDPTKWWDLLNATGAEA